MSDLSLLERRALYAIGRLWREDPDRATRTALAIEMGVDYQAAARCVRELLGRGLIRERSGFEVLDGQGITSDEVDPGRGAAEDMLRTVERDLADALRGDLTGFRLTLRVRSTLAAVRRSLSIPADA